MKFLIACDMEGVSGITSWNQVDPDTQEYLRFRHLMTGDVNAAIEGIIRAAGDELEEIQVTDGHWNSGNILIEELNPRAALNTGTPSYFSMVQGVDSGVNAALFVGYHAMVGTPNAILDHTWSSVKVNNLWLNGRLVGEFALNGSLCGWYNVPVIMVSGDQSVCAEARSFVPDVETAVVKTAGGRYAAKCLPLDVSRALISNAAEQAVRRLRDGRAPAPLRLECPVTVTLEFHTTNMADSASLMPGAVRLDGRKVEFTAADMPTAHRGFRALSALAG